MSLLDDVSIVVTPNGYKAGTLYAVVPVPTEGAEMLSQPVDLVTDFVVNSGGVIVDADTFTTSGGSVDGIKNNLLLTVGTRYELTIEGNTTSSGFLIGNTSASGNEYGSGFGTHIFTASTNTGLWLRQATAGTTNITSFSIKEYTSADMDVTRATAATRVDENGLIETVAANVPRIDYTGGGCPHILAEPQRTNIVFPSDVAVTQTRTVTAAEYTLSFYGTGSIVLSGTHSATLTGTGVNDRIDLTFTPSAGSLVLTVSGTVTNFQLEVGSYATSLIPTASGQVTRNQDIFTRDGVGSLINSTEGVLFVEVNPLHLSATNRYITIFDSSNVLNKIHIKFEANLNIQVRYYVNDVVSFTASYVQSDFTNIKIALKWKANDFALWISGNEEASQLSGTVNAASTFDTLSLAYTSGILNFNGEVKQLQVYDTALTDVQLAALTS